MMTSDSTEVLPTPADAWSAVLTHWSLPPPRCELTPLFDALGRVTAREVTSPGDSPPFERSAMDGYAVRAVDCSGAGSLPLLRVTGEVCMGQAADLTLTSGEAIWVATGSMVPPGADAVINVERTKMISGRVSVVGSVSRGDNIVPQAADFRRGERVLEAGRRLRAQDVAVLAGLGLPEVAVMRRPLVAILITGDELRLPGQCLAPGQIFTSNGYALAAQVAQAGGQAVVWPLIPDDLAAIVAALQEALETAEVVLLSGGSSVGRRDLTARALAAISGAQVLVRGVAAKPGGPSIVATVADRLIIGIPGHPAAAMISFVMFGEPAVHRLLRVSVAEAGMPRWGTRLMARLEAPLASRIGRQEYARVRLRRDPHGDWLATPVPGAFASLTTLVKGDGMITLAPSIECLAAGEEVDVTVY